MFILFHDACAKCNAVCCIITTTENYTKYLIIIIIIICWFPWDDSFNTAAMDEYSPKNMQFSPIGDM